MRKSLLLAVALGASPALAQVRVDVTLPSIHFAVAPPLVVVQPGVQVVEDYDDEIYFVDNWYWVRRDGRWFRTRTHTGGWVVVESRYVPATIVALPPGQYRRWKRGPDAVPPGHRKHEGRGKHRKHHD